METRDEITNRLLKFHPQVPLVFHDLDAFHEWNCEFAVAKFRAKRSNNEPVTFFNFQRHDGISVLETAYENDREKYAVMDTVREACRLGAGVLFLCSIHEAWIAAVMDDAAKEQWKRLRREGKAVKDMPGREDALVCGSYDRKGGAKLTRWVARLKYNPSNNRLLARDDVDLTGQEFYGPGFGFMNPVREVPDEY